LQEIKAKEEQIPPEAAIIPGYRSYFFPASRPGYSGVALYSRLEPEKIICGWGEKRFDEEGRVIIADYASFRLINAYFPNGGGARQGWRTKWIFAALC
jgi:exodeoxyribonuclease-3